MVDTDLVVVGAGGGLAGALRAAEHGLDVLVVEADEHFRRGNNTSMSTAMVPGAGTRFQRAAGIDDSPARFLADVDAKTAGEADPTVARALTAVSAELVEWLADGVGLPIELARRHGLPRPLGPPGALGARPARVVAAARPARRRRRAPTGSTSCVPARAVGAGASTTAGSCASPSRTRTAGARTSPRGRCCWPPTATAPTPGSSREHLPARSPTRPTTAASSPAATRLRLGRVGRRRRRLPRRLPGPRGALGGRAHAGQAGRR